MCRSEHPDDVDRTSLLSRVSLEHSPDDNRAVPGSGATLFQAATANLDPWTEARYRATVTRS